MTSSQPIVAARRTENIRYAVRDVVLTAREAAAAGKELLYLNIGDPLQFDFQTPPHIVDAIKNGEVQLIFNTTEGRQSHKDSYSIRRTALELKIPCYTTASAAEAAVKSLKKIDAGALEPRSLQSYSRGD